MSAHTIRLRKRGLLLTYQASKLFWALVFKSVKETLQHYRPDRTVLRSEFAVHSEYSLNKSYYY